MLGMVCGQYQSRAVIENEAIEASLPVQYKNHFYRIPRTRELLVRSSWLAPGENLVTSDSRIKKTVSVFLLLYFHRFWIEKLKRLTDDKFILF